MFPEWSVTKTIKLRELLGNLFKVVLLMLFDDLAFESKETEEIFHICIKLEYINTKLDRIYCSTERIFD